MRWDTKGALLVANLVAVGLFSAACATDPYGPDVYAPPGGPGYFDSNEFHGDYSSPYTDSRYDQPSYSVGVVAVVPGVPLHSQVTWYFGAHPRSDKHHDGQFCSLNGAHSHDFDPHRSHRYEFHDGYYFWLGDPVAFGLQTRSWAYFGHHPHPHYFGSHCYNSGRHHHTYSPRSSHSYDYLRGVFHFTGNFGSDYHERRKRYNENGWEYAVADRGYREHLDWKQYREHRAPKHHERVRHPGRDHRADNRTRHHDSKQADRRLGHETKRRESEDRPNPQADRRQRGEHRHQSAAKRDPEGHNQQQAVRRETTKHHRKRTAPRESGEQIRQRADQRNTDERVRQHATHGRDRLSKPDPQQHRDPGERSHAQRRGSDQRRHQQPAEQRVVEVRQRRQSQARETTDRREREGRKHSAAHRHEESEKEQGKKKQRKKTKDGEQAETDENDVAPKEHAARRQRKPR